MELTEFTFTLPQGLADPDGNVHRDGTMRLATAFDEIEPLKDPRRVNPGYLVIILLARVITRLGDLEHLNAGDREPLCRRSGLLAGLLPAHQRQRAQPVGGGLPHCSGEFEVEVGLGE